MSNKLHFCFIDRFSPNIHLSQHTMRVNLLVDVISINAVKIIFIVLLFENHNLSVY